MGKAYKVSIDSLLDKLEGLYEEGFRFVDIDMVENDNKISVFLYGQEKYLEENLDQDFKNNTNPLTDEDIIDTLL